MSETGDECGSDGKGREKVRRRERVKVKEVKWPSEMVGE